MLAPGGGGYRTRSGKKPRWDMGRFGCWAKTTHLAFLPFSYFSFSFSFLFEKLGFLNCIDLNNFKSAKFVKIGPRVFELNKLLDTK
jgi:hypothetical protein